MNTSTSSSNSSGAFDVVAASFIEVSVNATTVALNATANATTGNSTDTSGDISTVQMKQIWFTFGMGVVISLATLLLFALGMLFRITHIAPRCEARPRNVIYNPNPARDLSQDRGNPFLLGWVFWVMSLTYGELLAGVPGTGTRNGGLKGSMLTVNLDHILLLRFNALCLKISVVAMLVYVTINLPVYFYSRCADVPLGDEYDDKYSYCTDDPIYPFTSYSRFTLNNIPNLNTDDFFQPDYHLAAFRIYGVVLTSWIVLWFALFELFHEWIDVLAMRRVYYHEMDMWKERNKELQATMMQAGDRGRLGQGGDGDNQYMHNREAYIPHPEQRDTPPNIELYSVLVGGVPSKPKDVVASDDLETALSGDASGNIDWQLQVTAAFFDACVPNQPGFTSSVAAVTILPSATELAVAWKYWSDTSKKLSRLRFIRSRIMELGHVPLGQKLMIEPDETADEAPITETKKSLTEMGHSSDVLSSTRRKEYSAEILGGTGDATNDDFWGDLDLGPEQIAVYSKESAKSLAGCCPYGAFDQRITYCNDKDTLLEMEQEAADDLNAAYSRLVDAGNNAAFSKRERADMPTIQGLVNDNLGIDLSDLPRLNMSNRSGFLKSMHDRSLERKEASSSNDFETTTKSFTGLEAGVLKRQENLEKRRSNPTQGNVPTENSTPNLNFATARRGPPRQDLDADNSPNDTGLTQSSRDLQSSLLRRASARFRSSRTAASEAPIDINPWEMVGAIAEESKNNKQKISKKYKVANGRWARPSFAGVFTGTRSKVRSLFSWTGDTSEDATDVMARDSTYAVVTFTSRQAAIAARGCLADGRGAESFKTMDALPVPPLADAAAFNMCDCRGFTKPVTIGLNESQKNWRKSFVIVCVVFIYIFYTLPITWSAKNFTRVFFVAFPNIGWDPSAVEGLLNTGVLSCFLAALPDVFLFLANFGSNATSLVASENAALQFYWYFMVLYTYFGSSIANMAIEAYSTGAFEIKDILETMAATIPGGVSATWTQWIIMKTTMFHPLFYLFQANTWLSAMIGAKCCVRMFRGGGAGSRLPYRIYVESGTVLMCSLALAPAAPILAPFAVLYFVVCAPLLRYVVIFTYKPEYDSGGARWPFLFEMVIVSLLSGQIVLAMMVLAKGAVGPAILALIPFPATLMFRKNVRGRFLASYKDAALAQTALLDGWDTNEEATKWNYKRREQFRSFLVDSHKASFVPVCIAAVNQCNDITAQPAVVNPLTPEDFAQQLKLQGDPPDGLDNDDGIGASSFENSDYHSPRLGMPDRRRQFGALNNRQHLMTTQRDAMAEISPENNGIEVGTPKTFFPVSAPAAGLSPIADNDDEEEEEEECDASSKRAEGDASDFKDSKIVGDEEIMDDSNMANDEKGVDDDQTETSIAPTPTVRALLFGGLFQLGSKGEDMELVLQDGKDE